MSGEGAALRPLPVWEGEPVAHLEAAWGLPRLEVHASLGSTSDRLRDLLAAAEGALPWTTVIADEQTAGRGRGGRSWSSPAGRGLWMSTLLPGRAPAHRSLAPLLVGLGVCRAVEGVVDGARVRLKWPNDVLLSGRKICGILCEGGSGGVVAGIGLNVTQREEDFPRPLRDRAGSILSLTGREIGRARLARRVLEEVRRLLARPRPGLDDAVLDELAARDALRGVALEAGGATGTGAGIARDGALLVRRADGRTDEVRSGSVRVADSAERRGADATAITETPEEAAR